MPFIPLDDHRGGSNTSLRRPRGVRGSSVSSSMLSAIVAVMSSLALMAAGTACTNAANCNGHASAVSGTVATGCTCTCVTGYAGKACGSCASGYGPSPPCTAIRSVCLTGYTGPTCTACETGYGPSPPCTPILCTTAANCNGRASTVSGTVPAECSCTCSTGYTGSTCGACAVGYGPSPPCAEIACTNAANCNGRAATVKGTLALGCVCNCSVGYAGPSCGTCTSNCTATACTNLADCNGHAASVMGTLATGCACNCSMGYAGPSCALCASNYDGYPNCTATACTSDADCNGHAASVMGTLATGCACNCSVGYAGPSCALCASNYDGYPNCTEMPCVNGSNCNGYALPTPAKQSTGFTRAPSSAPTTASPTTPTPTKSTMPPTTATPSTTPAAAVRTTMPLATSPPSTADASSTAASVAFSTTAAMINSIALVNRTPVTSIVLATLSPAVISAVAGASSTATSTASVSLVSANPGASAIVARAMGALAAAQCPSPIFAPPTLFGHTVAAVRINWGLPGGADTVSNDVANATGYRAGNATTASVPNNLPAYRGVALVYGVALPTVAAAALSAGFGARWKWQLRTLAAEPNGADGDIEDHWMLRAPGAAMVGFPISVVLALTTAGSFAVPAAVQLVSLAVALDATSAFDYAMLAIAVVEALVCVALIAWTTTGSRLKACCVELPTAEDSAVPPRVQWIMRGSLKWIADEEEVDAEAPQTHWRAHFVYEQYRGRAYAWYLALDFGTAMLSALVGNVQSGNAAVCTATLALSVAATAIPTIAVVALRPLVSPLQQSQAVVNSVAALITACLAVSSSTRDYAAYAANVSTATALSVAVVEIAVRVMERTPAIVAHAKRELRRARTNTLTAERLRRAARRSLAIDVTDELVPLVAENADDVALPSLRVVDDAPHCAMHGRGIPMPPGPLPSRLAAEGAPRPATSDMEGEGAAARVDAMLELPPPNIGARCSRVDAMLELPPPNTLLAGGRDARAPAAQHRRTLPIPDRRRGRWTWRAMVPGLTPCVRLRKLPLEPRRCRSTGKTKVCRKTPCRVCRVDGRQPPQA